MVRFGILFVVACTLVGGMPLEAQELRPLGFDDMMKFRSLSQVSISDDGQWAVGRANPDRGDGEVLIFSTQGDRQLSVPRGNRPALSSDGKWASMMREPSFAQSQSKKGDQKSDLILVNLETFEITEISRVSRYTWTQDGRWVVYEPHPEKDEGEKKKDEPAASDDDSKDEPEPGPDLKLKDLVVLSLERGSESRLGAVASYSLHAETGTLAVVTYDEQTQTQDLRIRTLGQDEAYTSSFEMAGEMTKLTFSEHEPVLAFLGGLWDESFEVAEPSLFVMDPGEMPREVPRVDGASDAKIPEFTNLRWTRDGSRLFFGFVLEDSGAASTEEEAEDEGAGAESEQDTVDPFDLEAILAKRELDVWHWNDPLIIPHQKRVWNQRRQQTHQAVFHRLSQRAVALGDSALRQVRVSENPRTLIGSDPTPYEREITWDGRYADLFAVDIRNGSRQLVAKRHSGASSVSPDGRALVYYHHGHYDFMDLVSNQTRCLTDSLGVPFENEDHDYPRAPDGYGIAGWVAGESSPPISVLIYDKYDIWQFPTDGREPSRLTRGREDRIIYRILDLDREREAIDPGSRLWMSTYQEWEKTKGLCSLALNEPEAEIVSLFGGRKRYDFLAKAKHADRILYTRQSYREFPDLWVTDAGGHAFRKLSQVNPQVDDFDWGQAELVEWSSLDGKPLQGVLIKPDNYQPGQPIPILVYFYRFFSQRLYDFNTPVVNHRPCFPFYASHGYGIFLPDIRFEVGRPGLAATKCLVPGIQKIIDMGVADKEAIGLHGHSWSGYQAAFIITQTDIFACAIAGAPVSNMTSAYGGIRRASGMARQFQYEMTQSRIGGSLWEYPERYVENSPLFFADRVNTPLLIQFGDEDGAVPWEQGIELYLGLRRLDKDCVFLQYRGEPHHLQKYANKLDYAMKMKEYLDFYLRDGEPKEWIVEGVPYGGK